MSDIMSSRLAAGLLPGACDILTTGVMDDSDQSEHDETDRLLAAIMRRLLSAGRDGVEIRSTSAYIWLTMSTRTVWLDHAELRALSQTTGNVTPT